MALLVRTRILRERRLLTDQSRHEHWIYACARRPLAYRPSERHRVCRQPHVVRHFGKRARFELWKNLTHSDDRFSDVSRIDSRLRRFEKQTRLVRRDIRGTQFEFRRRIKCNRA